MSPPIYRSLSIGLVLSVVAAPLVAQEDCRESRLTALDAEPNMRLGSSLDLGGSTLAVGAPLHRGLGAQAGAVYVFEHSADAWNQVALLQGTDTEAGDGFGTAVAVDGDRLVVGAPGDDDQGTNAGAAYIFERLNGTWFEVAKFTAVTGAAGDRFGMAVDVDDDLVVVGAPYHDVPHADAGSAFVFERLTGGWIQRYRAEAFDAAYEDRFGMSVCIEGDWFLVGAPYDDDNGADSGSAYAFLRNVQVWDQRTKLLPIPGGAPERFGASVAMSGIHAVVGCASDDTLGNNVGSATTYLRSGAFWFQEQTLVPQFFAAGDLFGSDVAIDRQLIVVGMEGRGRGTSLAFQREAGLWVEHNAIGGSLAGEQNVGAAVGFSHDRLVLGAPGTDGSYTNMGAILAYRVEGLVRRFGDGLAGTDGWTPALDVQGCARPTESLTFTVQGGLGSAFGAFLVARHEAHLPFYGGTLHLLPPFVGMVTHLLSPGAPGDGSYSFSTLPFDASMSGLSFFAQAGYLDPGALAGVSLTGAVEVTFR